MEDTKRMSFLKNLSKKRNIDFKRILEILLDAQVSLKKITKSFNINGKEYIVEKIGTGPIINRYGRFYQCTFEINDRWIKYFVITKSGLNKEYMTPCFDASKEVYLRIDSGCSSGQL